MGELRPVSSKKTVFEPHKHLGLAMDNTASHKMLGTIAVVVQYTLLVIVAIIMLVPFIWMFSTSLKPEEYILRISFLPEEPTFDSYLQLFEVMPMGRMMFNSFFITITATVMQIAVAAMAGYAFGRMRWRGRDWVFALYLATMMIPAQVVIIPRFVIVSQLGWLNTYQALLLPWLFDAFAVFLMRQAFMTLPVEMDEAAVMDGANHWTIFWRILLPLVKPVLATLTVLAFMRVWNDYMWPLFVARKPEMMTLPLGLATLHGSDTSLTSWNLVMAGAVITVLPILLVYLFAQKWFVQGAVISGIKG